MSGPIKHILECERVNDTPQLVQITPAFGVMLALAWARVGDLALNLDHQNRRSEVEVNSRDRSAAPFVNHLSGRPGKASFAT